MDGKDEKNWFSAWFDSPYYHILYGDRNEAEAEAFVRELIGRLNMPVGSRVLDLACGRGRHSVMLNRLGMQVTGLDLSPQSIAYAKQSENATLEFFEHDMRKPFRSNYYDYVLNLFTSFGYFGCRRDNCKVTDAVYKGLKPGGIFVLDFFNCLRVQKEIGNGTDMKKTAGGIHFHIHKSVADGYIVKEIRFSDKGRDFYFRETVQALQPADLRALLEPHFKILHLSGDYRLSAFDEHRSDRCIVIAQKPA